MSLGDLQPELLGTPWRLIQLSAKHDVWCLVDAIDHPWLTENNWNISWGSRTRWQLYAKRNVGVDRATVRMHREIMLTAEPLDWLKAAKRFVDHINGQTLDNRRCNLRWSTAAANAANKRSRDRIPSLESILAELLEAVLPVRHVMASLEATF